jgi:hypothetical protein
MCLCASCVCIRTCVMLLALVGGEAEASLVILEQSAWGCGLVITIITTTVGVCPVMSTGAAGERREIQDPGARRGESIARV